MKTAKYIGCFVEGCNRKHSARGYCNLHVKRLDRHGDVEYSSRQLKGFDPHAKLELEDVEEIKRRLRNPYRGLGRELARRYGVSDQLISRIKHGDAWYGDLEEAKDRREKMLKVKLKGGE